MNKKLHISAQLSLSLETVTNTIAILARRRVGKSYTGAVAAEEMIKAGLPWVALDPTGVWWGLGSSADGKHEGFPVIVVGGPHAHIPLEPNAGKIIANMIVDNPGWYVIDFSRFNNDDEIYTFAAAFGRQLYYRHQRKAEVLHVFLDEADIFIPQVPVNKLHLQVFRAFDNIERRGGVYGLGMTMISQRPALINKNNLTQCETLIALRTSAPLDQDPIFNWVSRNGTKAQLEQIRQSLASLGVGEAWYFSPDSNIFKRIQIRTRESFNSSATPTPGAKAIEPKVFSKVDLDKLGEQIKATVEKSKKEDPQFLHQEIRRLEREKADMQRAQENMVPAAAAPKIIEKPILDNDQYESIAAFYKQADERARVISVQLDELHEKASKDLAMIIDEIAKPKQSLDAIKKLLENNHQVSVIKPAQPTVTASRTKLGPIVLSTKGIEPGIANAEPPTKIPWGPLMILQYCAMHPEGLRRDQLTVLTGYKKDTRNQYIRELINWGFVQDNGAITITQQGILALGSESINLPEGEQLRQQWVSLNLPKGESEILTVLINEYPSPVSRNTLTDRTGYKKDTRNQYIRNLIKYFLVDDLPSSMVKASDYLFT